MPSIDLNGDMGEGFGVYSMGNDESLMHYVTSVNIACGAHSGDAATMDKTVRLAKDNKLAIGAHPGFPDITGFGRRMMFFQREEIYRMIVWQLGGLKAFCDIHHVSLNHVKPHGALYNLATRDKTVAEAISDAVARVDKSLIMYGLPNSELLKAAKSSGLTIANEVFADRTYQADGTLTPRSEPNSMIENISDMKKHVERMVHFDEVVAVTGEIIPVHADTICIHGDSDQALLFAESILELFNQTGIAMQAIESAYGC